MKSNIGKSTVIFRSWVNINVALIVAASVATVALIAVAWYLAAALAPIHGYLATSLAVERAIHALEERMVGDETDATLRDIRGPLNNLIVAVNELTQRKEDLNITPDAGTLLWVAEWKLSLAQNSLKLNEKPIEEGVLHLRRALETEIAVRANLLSALEHRSKWIFRVSMIFVVGLVMSVASLTWLLKDRFFRPLKDLREFLQKVERREYASFSSHSVDTVLEPLFTQYNTMVRTLAEYDEANLSRQSALRAEVRNASRALLEQQIALSRAQQQAAAGELSASIAHEIRNPLAGMALALASLRDELKAPEHLDRVDLVIDELNRVKRLLSTFLDKTRMKSEQVSTFKLSSSIESFIHLARYQIPDNIELSVDVPDELHVRLPESSLRQAVLNLLLNAAHAIGNHAGTIVIGGRCDENELCIVVRDSGPGFSRDLLVDGIQPFNTQRRGGSGLGLATVRRFAQSQDGVVKLANSDDGGAVVTLSFPKEKCVHHE